MKRLLAAGAIAPERRNLQDVYNARMIRRDGKTYDKSTETHVNPPAMKEKMGNLLGRIRRQDAAFLLTFGSAVSILFSIALSQILLGLAIANLLVNRRKIRFPRVMLPLLLFVMLTFIAIVLSPDPIRGFPQIKKIYVFAILPMVYTTFTSIQQIRYLVSLWSIVGVLSALASIGQYVHRYRLALEQYAYDYGFFLDGRIRGFASHWMTFGGEQMVVLLLLLSFLLFARPARWRWMGGACALILWVSVILGLTRSIFLLGLPAGLIYLLLRWKGWAIALIPVLLLAELLLGPVQVRERVRSAISPHQELDSNTHRTITRRTGWQMVKRHPWFGLGPEQVGPQFLVYAPADIARPLPKGYYGHLHNIYLQYAAERGVPALLMFLWFIGKMARDFYQGSKRAGIHRDVPFVLNGALAVIIALLLEGLFEYNFGDSEILTLFLTLVAAAYRALEIAAFDSEPIEASRSLSMTETDVSSAEAICGAGGFLVAHR